MLLFAISCRQWPCRRFRWASNLAFQQWRTKLKRHWKIAHSCRSPTASALLCYHVSNRLSLYIAQGRLAIEYPLSKLRNCSCHLKRKNISTWSVLLAWSLPTKCFWVILGRLTSERKTYTSRSSFSIGPPLKRQAPCLYMLLWISLLQSAFWHQRAHSSTWVDLLAIQQITQSAQAQIQLERDASTRGQGNHMHDHSWIQLDIDDVTGISLSLSLSFYYSRKATHAQYRKRFRASYNVWSVSLWIFSLCPPRSSGIGVWYTVMYIMVIVSILTNCLIFGFSSEQLLQWLPSLFEHVEGDQQLKMGYGR